MVYFIEVVLVTIHLIKDLEKGWVRREYVLIIVNLTIDIGCEVQGRHTL